ncbi:MAG: DUF3795 domain-containing protein [Anaerolineae bacterium]|nr:MAG: DUF3795 domain-containing protein [Anaerolineae bacterium]
MSECKRRLAAVCGLYCGTCEACEAEEVGLCRGCAYQLGLAVTGECRMFQCCVVERGLEHCGLCPDFACQLFLSSAEPMEVNRRYRALLRRAEIGTEAWIEEQEEARARGVRHPPCRCGEHA